MNNETNTRTANSTVPDGLAKELAALDAKATPGPWEVDTTDSEGEYGIGPNTTTGFKVSCILTPDGKSLADALNSDMIVVHEEFDEDGCYAWDETSANDFALIVALRNNLPAILASLSASNAMRDALRECAETFRDYEQQHRAKGTAVGTAKAERNREMAEKCEALVNG